MLSIIFITHNRKDELFRALCSCFRQSYKDVEYIIVDNGSDERFGSSLEMLMEEYHVSRYQYQYLDTNIGVAGRNLGFKSAKGEYCLFLDDDAVLIDEKAIEWAIQDFANSNISAVACNIYQPIDNTYLFSKYINIAEQIVMTYVGAAHFLRTSFWRDNKLYPDNIMYGSEEMYASLFIYKNSSTIYYDERIRVNHLPSSINRMNNRERDLNIVLNTYVCRKYFYPNIIIPLLKITFYLRLKKNDLWKRREIIDEIRKRYDRDNENKMTIMEFVAVCKIMLLRNMF